MPDETLKMCDTVFWDWDLAWNNEKPHITTCFQQSVISILPCVFLLLMNFFNLFLSSNDSPFQEKYPCTLLYAAKIICNISLMGVLFIQFIYLLYQRLFQFIFIPVVDYISITIRFIGVMTALLVLIQQRRKGILNSKRLFYFWLAATMCEFIRSPVFNLITDSWNNIEGKFNFVTEMIIFAICVNQLFFSIFSDPEYRLLFKVTEDDYVIDHQPVLSHLTFFWMTRLILYGKKNKIEIKDFDQLNPNQRSISTNEKLENCWLKEITKYCGQVENNLWQKNKPSPSLFFVLLKVLAKPLLTAAALEFVYVFVNLAPAILLDAMISFTENAEEPRWHGFIYAFSLFFISIIGTFLWNHTLLFQMYAAAIPKVGLLAFIYRKAIRLSSTARQNYTTGELCNLMTVDVQKVLNFIFVSNATWTSPLRIIIILILLWQYLGVACLAGITVLLLLMPISAYLASKTHEYQATQMKTKDNRLKQMSETLNGIKVLKLFAWELAFMDRISEIRKKEVITIKKIAFLNALMSFVWNMAPFMVAITSFVTFLLMDENNVLNPSIAFVSLMLFNRLRASLNMIPEVITEIVQSMVSIKRIQNYLLADEIKEENITNNVPEGVDVIIENAYFAWSSEHSNEPFLRDITMKVSEGQLVGVVGQVGSGKSALLSALLGEMHKISGKVNIRKGQIGYVAQQAWIQNESLQNNILFLKPMCKDKYRDVIEKCCLKDDLQILPSGDQTEIGEKGVNLSGGQKQRVSLARALYQNADIYFLDDPLSAVDSHVGAQIFSNIIGPKGILKNKTRILVTHDLSHLPEMDMILVIVEGKIQEMGTYQELMNNGKEFSKFVEEHVKIINEDNDNSNSDEMTHSEVFESDLQKEPSKISRPLSINELKDKIKRVESQISRRYSKQDSVVATQNKKHDPKLIEKEKMEEGKVKAGIFFTYFRNATFHLILFMILSFGAYQGFEIGANVWLSLWSSDNSNDVKIRNLRISVYGLLGLGQGLSVLVAAFLLAVAGTRASRRLHASMLISILRSPMAFFEKTPIGRILNRFGKDVDIVDSFIPRVLSTLIMSGISLIGIIVVVSINSAIIIAIIIPFLIICLIIQDYYAAGCRQTKRINAVTFSPVVSNFSETIQGASTIRAFRAQNFFIRKEDDFVDNNYRVMFASMVMNRWLSIRMELIANLLVLAIGLYVAIQREEMGAGIAGLTLSYVLNLSGGVSMIIRFYTSLEVNMISVERIDEYSELPPEAPWKLNVSTSHSIHWPNKGKISFENYQIKYQKSHDLVLKGIDIMIPHGQKVGIVGRTGAGKSSLVAGLFRLLEPCGGKIIIDEIDIASLGLHDLRPHITIIPQDPILFSGSIRLNLDPFNEYSDEKIWDSLSHAHLKDFIISLESGLEHCLTEGGDNISVGQRQQMCLARALLKRTTILVLDEATAAVDMETDRLIQETIRLKFSDCTILTIAHRIYTILDYDRIIVMDDGKVSEEGTPDDLLQNDKSMFYQLAKEAGLL